ncbi:MAG: CPBP family intramembrane metalloprotease [Candidatus Didemnitutus sp.]|nr:CPBP family intramembrane metalloprotease [Candidatus Didemnitutus sp.]
MSLTPLQILAASIELFLLVVGAWMLARALSFPQARQAIFGRNRISPWSLSGHEVVLLILAICMCGLIGQGLAVNLFRAGIAESADHRGLEVVLFGFGFHAVALLGWPLFFLLRRMLHQNYGAGPPPMVPARKLSPTSLVKHSVITLLLVLPTLTLISLGWTALLRAFDFPDAPQDLIEVFGNVQSPLVLAAMLIVACVIAPLNEELLFRGVIFRFCRQRFGRGIALVVSGVLFGALHGNLAGFVPLAVFGAALAIAYEQSGDLRVSIVAHALFNFNTTMLVLAGLPGV